MYLDEGLRVEFVELGHPAGLGHGVPLMGQPACVQQEGVVVVGHLGRVEVGTGEELGAAAGGGEREARRRPVVEAVERLTATVVEIPDRVAGTGVHRIGLAVFGRRARPLHRRAAEPVVGHPAQVVAGVRVREPFDLLEHLLGARIVEGVGVPHLGGDARDELPVRDRLSGGIERGFEQGEVAFGVDHHTGRLRPQRRGQHHVGVLVGLGVDEGVLGDHELGALESLDDGLAIRHRGNGIGADDPARLDLAVGHPAEHVDGAAAHVGAQGPGRNTPDTFHELTVRRGYDGALAGQARAHVTHLASAHGVRLPGQ